MTRLGLPKFCPGFLNSHTTHPHPFYYTTTLLQLLYVLSSYSSFLLSLLKWEMLEELRISHE